MTEIPENKLPFPEVLRLEPAATCNFRCIHCPTGLGLSPAGLMSKETFNVIFDKIKKFHFRAIVLYHGGEPLLNKYFYSMVKRLRPLADKIKTNTNGSLFNDKNITAILDCGIDLVVLSLDGLSAEENDQIRVGCDFYKVIESLKKLLQLKLKLGLSKPEICIHNAQIADNNSFVPGEVKKPQYIVEALGELSGQVSWDPIQAYLWPGLPIPVLGSIPGRNFCDSAVNTITIRWNGDVVPCCNDLTNRMVMGNVLREDIEEIWNNEKYEKLRQDINSFNPPPLCHNCSVLFPAKLMFKKHLNLLKVVR